MSGGVHQFPTQGQWQWRTSRESSALAQVRQSLGQDTISFGAYLHEGIYSCSDIPRSFCAPRFGRGHETKLVS